MRAETDIWTIGVDAAMSDVAAVLGVTHPPLFFLVDGVECTLEIASGQLHDLGAETMIDVDLPIDHHGRSPVEIVAERLHTIRPNWRVWVENPDATDVQRWNEQAAQPA